MWMLEIELGSLKKQSLFLTSESLLQHHGFVYETISWFTGWTSNYSVAKNDITLLNVEYF